MVFEFPSNRHSEPIRISVRPASTIVAAGESFSFDALGRLFTASTGSLFLKRGLSNRVLVKSKSWSVGQKDSIRSDLTVQEKIEFFDRVAASIEKVISELPEDTPPFLLQRLKKISTWNFQSYQEEESRFNSIYSPVSILPPDQYMALVLQATLGCHYNQCTFCNFYSGIPFKIRDQKDFRKHIHEVNGLLGGAIDLRNTIFLADANALIIPQKKLIPLFRILNESYEIAPAGLEGQHLNAWKRAHRGGFTGVYSFIDAFTGSRKSTSDWHKLKHLGLRRIYVGMETGHIPLLKFLEKPGMPEDIFEVVKTAKASGIHVGVIIMIGIGGDAFKKNHENDTISLINKLDLGDGDLIYLSEYMDHPDSRYSRRAEMEGIKPLNNHELVDQTRRFQDAFRVKRGHKVAVYDIREFVY